MATKNNIEILISATDEASKVLKETTKEVTNFANSSKSISDVREENKGKITASATAIFAGIGYYLKQGIDDINSYQYSIQRLTTLTKNSTGATKKEVDVLVKQAEALEKVGVATNAASVLDYTEDISISADNDTHLSFLQKVLNQVSDYGLFLTADNNLYFTPYQTKHILTYNDDCYNIELSEDSTEYYNKITLKYTGGSLTSSNSSSIDLYGESYLVTEELEIKNSSTANLRIKSLLKEYDIVRNYKISVNSNIDYYTIKPGDLVSVRNTNRIIENKPVKQIQYSRDTAIIILDSYQSLEKFIINQK